MAAKWSSSTIDFSIVLIVLIMLRGANCDTGSETHSVTVTNQSLDQRFCTYRYFDPLPIDLFKLVSGWSCYNYANKKWMTNGTIATPHMKKDELQPNYKIPYVIIGNDEVFFDYENVNYLEAIKTLHAKENYFHKWLDCAMAAMDCCRNHLTTDNIPTSDGYPCPAMWDGYTCYEKTQGDTTVHKLCPLYLTSSDKFICNLESSKECNIDGWNHQTDYLPCSSSFRHRDRHTFHIIVIAVATVFMAPSTIIFFAYEKLQKWRIALHRNLILAIFTKNILVLISKNVIIMDAINVAQTDSVMESDGTWCRVLSFFENLSKSLIFTCMTADAYNSHKTIVRAFSSDSNVYMIYGIIAGASIIPTIIWSILMGVNNVGNCWFVDNEGYQWVTDGYKYACLIINVLLLCDIVRVLFMKLGKATNKTFPGRSLKATIILIFLFGLPLLISGQRDLVNHADCLSSDIYTYSTYSIEALQGIFMSLFFCYLNPDALREIKHSWRNLTNRIRELRSLRDAPRRRTTTTTLINMSMKT